VSMADQASKLNARRAPFRLREASHGGAALT
jgi:hypothetical protein